MKYRWIDLGTGRVLSSPHDLESQVRSESERPGSKHESGIGTCVIALVEQPGVGGRGRANSPCTMGTAARTSIVEAVEGLLADTQPATNLDDFLAALHLVQGVNGSLRCRDLLRGIVCVSLAGLPARLGNHRSLVFRVSRVLVSGGWVILQMTEDARVEVARLERPANSPSPRLKCVVLLERKTVVSARQCASGRRGARRGRALRPRRAAAAG